MISLIIQLLYTYSPSIIGRICLIKAMLQLLIVGYVIYEIIRLSNLPDAGNYAPPEKPQSALPVFPIKFFKTNLIYFFFRILMP